MFKLFKSVDRKLEERGFRKVEDRDFAAVYEKEDDYGYVQVLDIRIRNNGRTYIQSYDKELFDTKGIGNTCVALSYEETKLALAKMKQLLRKRKRMRLGGKK